MSSLKGRGKGLKYSTYVIIGKILKYTFMVIILLAVYSLVLLSF